MKRKFCFIAFIVFLSAGNAYLFSDDEILRLELNEIRGRLDVMAQNYEELMKVAENQNKEIQLLRETRMSLTIGLLINDTWTLLVTLAFILVVIKLKSVGILFKSKK